MFSHTHTRTLYLCLPTKLYTRMAATHTHTHSQLFRKMQSHSPCVFSISDTHTQWWCTNAPSVCATECLIWFDTNTGSDYRMLLLSQSPCTTPKCFLISLIPLPQSQLQNFSFIPNFSCYFLFWFNPHQFWAHLVRYTVHMVYCVFI